MAIAGVNDLATTHPNIAAELGDQSLATQLKAGSNRKVWWVCSKNPAHRWQASPDQRTGRGSGCPFCSGRVVEVGVNDLWTTHPELAAELVNPEEGYVLKAGSERKVEWRCRKHPEHVWKATPSNRTRRGSGCPFCSHKRVDAGVSDLATTHPEVARRLADPSMATQLMAGSGRKVLWRCEDHPEHTWWDVVYREAAKPVAVCPICSKSHRSAGEMELEDVVGRLLGDGVEVLTSVRGIIGSDRELDIYVPSLGVALEYDGVYWHSERAGRDAKYHADKHRRCVGAGIRLVRVWEDDWADRRDVCIRMVAAKLGVTDRLGEVLGADALVCGRVGARQCTVGAVEPVQAGAFLDANHIQGRISATYHLGLWDGDGNLRAVMSLRSARAASRAKRDEGEWEIARYATCGQVMGGFTKLLAYAERVVLGDGHPLIRWVTFSDNDISDGALYRSHGFRFDRELPPDYKYVGSFTHMKRCPKEAFQRKRFREDPDLVWNEAWTEHVAALNNGLYRVYDSGKTRWVKDVGWIG